MLEKILKTSTIVCLTGLAAWGCSSREDKLGDLNQYITFTHPVVVQMSQEASGSEKRKFADFNGDGLEDMGEVTDEKLFGQDYQLRVFPGYMNDDNLLTFGSNTFELKIPLKKRFASSATKIDSGEVNGDGYADIIFTRFVQKWGDDEYHAEIALNNADGTFTYATSSVRDISTLSEDYKANEMVRLSLALSFLAQRNYAMYGYYSSDSISSYLMLDWADANGDGKDDLYVFWRTSDSDLLTTVFPVEEISNGQIYFGRPSTSMLESFMHDRFMRHVDTEDYDGDGIADICIYEPDGDELELSLALGSFDNSQVRYQPQKDVRVKDTDLDFWTTLEKYDSFDGDDDGRADVVHIGKLDGERVLSYNFTRPFDEE